MDKDQRIIERGSRRQMQGSGRGSAPRGGPAGPRGDCHAVRPLSRAMARGVWGEESQGMTRSGDPSLGPETERPGWPLVAFALVTVAGLFLVIVLGFLDTATDSALGCGRSFPLCHGSLFPADNLKSLVEWSHRAASGVVGIMTGILGVWAWVRVRKSLEVRWLSWIAIAFIFIESALGAMAVLSPEPDPIIALHLGIALTAFAATVILTGHLVRLRRGENPRSIRPSTAVVRLSWVFMIYMYVAVYAGAYVAQTDSGISCLSWPLCPGPLVPTHWGPIMVDDLHRLVAVGAGVVALFLYRAARRDRDRRPDLLHLAAWILGWVLAQIAGGLLLVETHIALETTMLHVATATFLFVEAGQMLFGVLPAARLGERRRESWEAVASGK